MRKTDFAGSVVIVTGASQGIGAAISSTFAIAGARVVVHYRSNKDAADAVVSAIIEKGGTAVAIAAALDQPDDVQRLIYGSVKAFGTVDVLINNAGSFPNAPLLDLSPTAWRQMYADNVDSTFYCTQAVASHLKKSANGGAIVNISSISGLNPGQEHSHYNSAKAAVIMFTQSAAQELGPFNIRVNGVAPGLVHRPGLETQWPEGVKRFLHASPLSSLVQPEDVANACLFLASENAARITGTTIPVDSGVLSAMIY